MLAQELAIACIKVLTRYFPQGLRKFIERHLMISGSHGQDLNRVPEEHVGYVCNFVQ
jgi:hypothetical protein